MTRETTGGSSAHLLDDFLGTLSEQLNAAAAGHLMPAAIAASVELLAEKRRTLRAITPAPGSRTTVPVRRFWQVGLADVGPDVRRLAESLRRLEPHLCWGQNANYRRQPPSPGFLDNYGFAVIVGRESGTPALAYDAQLALGVLALGPHTEYPPHQHPALEQYVPLAVAGWWHDGDSWRHRSAGSVIQHDPEVAHAMRTGDRPLLAIYLWRGDVLASSDWSPRRAG
jgi:hypothetical protein